MITLEGPHMGLNDRRSWSKVQMWNTCSVAETESREHIIEHVANIAGRAPGGKLKNLVFSCHGSAGYVQMGQAFDRSHASMFRAWTGLVEKIWFHCCSVARITTPNSPSFGDGNLFCSEVARAAGCYVVASTETQVGATGRVLPYGRLDTFEGLVLVYGPNGGVMPNANRHPSTYLRNPSDPGSWAQNPD
ncbi:MAG: hypothetical protein ACREO5_06350 [Candidatus Binatia bacterium]